MRWLLYTRGRARCCSDSSAGCLLFLCFLFFFCVLFILRTGREGVGGARPAAVLFFGSSETKGLTSASENVGVVRRNNLSLVCFSRN